MEMLAPQRLVVGPPLLETLGHAAAGQADIARNGAQGVHGPNHLMEPSVLPAPTMVCSSSIKRMMRPSEDWTSFNTALRRSSNSPRYLAPAMSDPRSKAKMVLSFKPSGTSFLTMRMTVRALAEKWWNGTGLAVHPGETYAIEAKGTWSDASHACDATGWDGLAWMAGLRRVPEKNWFYLCLAVSADPLLECKNAGFFQGLFSAVAQIDKKSTIIPVGCAQTVTISRPGLAYFFANDAPTHYGNNLGYLDVTITRIA